MTSARAGAAPTRRAAARRQPPDWSFADRLRKIRVDVAEMRQEQFANELSVTKAALAAWETGRSRPRDILAFAKRVELLSGVPAAWILGVESPYQDPDGNPQGSVETGSITGRLATASSGAGVPSSLVLTLPPRNRVVASGNGSPGHPTEHAAANTTCLGDARTEHHASAA